jgi:hypothetical protein
VSLVFAGALSLIASETSFIFAADAQTAAASMGDARPASTNPAKPTILAAEPVAAGNPDPAERSARSIECSQKADAQGLQGKTRRHFLRECKRGS